MGRGHKAVWPEIKTWGVLGLIHAEPDWETKAAAAKARAQEDFLAQAYAAIQCLAKRQDSFTTDDVWRLLAEMNNGFVREPRLLGLAMRRARRDRLIYPQNYYVKSIRGKCHHRPLQLWRSLIYRGGESGNPGKV